MHPRVPCCSVQKFWLQPKPEQLVQPATINNNNRSYSIQNALPNSNPPVPSLMFDLILLPHLSRAISTWAACSSSCAVDSAALACCTCVWRAATCPHASARACLLLASASAAASARTWQHTTTGPVQLTKSCLPRDCRYMWKVVYTLRTCCNCSSSLASHAASTSALTLCSTASISIS